MSENNVGIGIVGGGRGGSEIYEIYRQSETVAIRFIVDQDRNAPALRTAAREGVQTFTDIREALKAGKVDFIIEATGSPKVLEIIKSHASDSTEVLSSKAALMFFNILEENRRQLNRKVLEEIRDIQRRIVGETEHVRKALAGIREVADNIEMLALNAAIEAAHAGQQGKGFAVVAEAVRKTSDKSRDLTGVIEQVNREIMELSSEIESSLKRLE